ncbi:MAG TPA: helix-turn-helix domain-containing protein [Solirubrobacterales bacterium]|jgi:transcriptional regulator with XRE-family HTH domain
MDSPIGNVFREARNRRKIDLSEVEEATRIRVRYLRAIENGEWDVLPGGVYTRGFIRAYATFLGLDGERLAEDYRRSVEGGRLGPASEMAPAAASTPARRRPVPGAGLLAVVAVVTVAVIAIVAIPGGGGNGGSDSSERPSSSKHDGGASQLQTAKPPASKQGVSMRLVANAEVWVCVLDARGRPLVDGQILEAGAEEGPFRSGSFTVSFGNGEVSMLINGREAAIPSTSSPIGYSIGRAGVPFPLEESERPTCA